MADTGPLRLAPFRRLWISTGATAIGGQLTAVAVPLQVYDLTGSSGWVGLSGAVALVPLIVFGLWGGAIADSVDRRKLLLITNTGIAATSLLFWLQAAQGWRSVWVIFALLALQQAFFGVNQPARSASIPRLVPTAQLPAANALNATVMLAGMVFGPLLAGALIPFLGLPRLYLIDSLGLCVVLWAVWRLPALRPLGGGSSARALPRDVIEGFRYLAPRRVLLVSFLADIIAMVFGMPRALFPELAQRTFSAPLGSSVALGILYAAIPIGAVIGGVFSGAFTRIRRQGAGVVVAVIAWGVAVVAFGLAPNLWMAVLFLALGGAADLVSMVLRNSILQSAAVDEMRGRMQGVSIVVVSGGPRLADLLHGTAGAVLGPNVTIAAGGILTVLAMLLVAAILPAFWAYKPPAETAAQPTQPAEVDSAPERTDLSPH